MRDCQQLSATSCMRSLARLCRYRVVTDQLPSVAVFLVAVSSVSTQGRHTPAITDENGVVQKSQSIYLVSYVIVIIIMSPVLKVFCVNADIPTAYGLSPKGRRSSVVLDFLAFKTVNALQRRQRY